MSFIIRYFAGSFIIRNEESYSIDESSNIQLKVADNKNNTPTPINEITPFYLLNEIYLKTI